jgi:putative ABC transport system permease protein
VFSAGLVFPLPLSNDPVGFPFIIDGAPSGKVLGAYYRDVSVGYFETMGIQLLQGRTFTELDNSTSPQVAIINQSMAQRFWPDQSPLGKHITIIDRNHQNQATSREIVGIVGDVKHNGLEARSGPEMYTPFLQAPCQWMTLVVRSKVDPGSLSRAITNTVHEVDPMVPVPEGRTMQEWLSRSVAPRRFNSTLLGWFAVLALTLTGVGMWGILFYSVTQRIREMGIRMALGAQRGDVVRMVLGQGFKLAIIGSLIGLPLAFALSQSIRSMLFRVGPADPLTFILVPSLLLFTALLASSVPAWRASALDPMMALRHE